MSFFGTYQFANPHLLWLLLIIPFLVFYFHYQQKQKEGIQSSTFLNFGQIHFDQFEIYNWILNGCKLLAFALLIIALSRPQVSVESESYLEHYKEGIDIVLSMDLSGSMLAEDFKPNRYEASLDVAKNFISKRKNDRIGIVAFQGQAYTQCPLTSDTKVALELLSEMERDVVEDGTAIGMGLATAINRLRESSSKSKVVILLTDGVNRDGEIHPLTAAEMAKEHNIRVYTIGVGTNGMAPYPFLNPYTGQKEFQPMEVEIDEEILEKIAKETDGKYFRATNNEALAKIYAEIDVLEKEKIKAVEYEIDLPEKFHAFLILAICLLLIENIIRNTFLKSIT